MPTEATDPTGLEAPYMGTSPSGGVTMYPDRSGDDCCFDKCKSKLPIIGPLLWLSGQPIIPVGGKTGGATPGTSPASICCRKIPGRGRFWAPTGFPYTQTTRSLGGAIGRWVPIIGTGLTAVETFDFIKCMSDCAGE